MAITVIEQFTDLAGKTRLRVQLNSGECVWLRFASPPSASVARNAAIAMELEQRRATREAARRAQAIEEHQAAIEARFLQLGGNS